MDLLALSNSSMGGVVWWQNWTSYPDLSLDGGSYPIEYVPMIWNANFKVATVDSQIPPGAKYLLTFYLPNVTKDQVGKEQSSVPVSDAVAAWAGVRQVATDRGLKVVSPSVDYCDPSQETCLQANPITWMRDFMTTCPSCQFDYVGVSSHSCNVSDFITEIGTYETAFPNNLLWITSFGCTDVTDPSDFTTNPIRFMTNVVTYLESEPQVFRYGWFTGFSDSGDGGPSGYSLLEGPGSSVLTPLGTAYVTLP
jgi:hypothetical protein